MSERAVGELAQGLRERGCTDCALAIVLGSGLGAFAAELEDARSIAFEELAAMPLARVPGHSGRFVVGHIAGVRVLVQQGRVHLYEGQSPAQVTRAVRAFAQIGCRGLLLTNAAGGLDPSREVPYLMRLEDHINLQGVTPLARDEAGRQIVYDQALGRAIDAAAEECGLELARGVYAGLLGPSYESPAEIRMLAQFGAQAVGMSTVAEALAAHASGLRVAAISCISNLAAGLSATPLSHAEVVAAGQRIAQSFARLIRTAVPRLAREVVVG